MSLNGESRRTQEKLKEDVEHCEEEIFGFACDLARRLAKF